MAKLISEATEAKLNRVFELVLGGSNAGNQGRKSFKNTVAEKVYIKCTAVVSATEIEAVEVVSDGVGGFSTLSGGRTWTTVGTKMFTTARGIRNKFYRAEPLGANNDEVVWVATISSSGEGGHGYKVVIVSGSGTDYLVEVHAGFPFNDTAETQFTGTLELLYTIENDLPVDTELFAQCFLNPDYNEGDDPEDQYKCYLFENVLGVY